MSEIAIHEGVAHQGHTATIPCRPVTASPPRFEIVRETVESGPFSLEIERPRSAEDLIDEEEFASDERLPYWAELWPSARVLARVVAGRPLAGRRVLELGCGIGLPSIAALAAGANPLATDWYADALRFAKANALRATGRPLETMLVDWRSPPEALLERAPFDLVIGADLLYEERNGRALAALLPRLAPPGGEVLICDPRRPDAVHLLEPLGAAGWRHEVEELRYEGPLDESGPVIRIHRLHAPNDRDRV
jgi:predicted nicotinamide N-methyase